MTDVINGMSQNSESSAPVVVEAHAPQDNERVFKQSEVNEIIKKAKFGAVEDFKRLHTQQPNYAAEKYGDSSPKHDDGIASDKLQKMIDEAAARHVDKIREEAVLSHQHDQAQRIVQNFQRKTLMGREKFQDFDTVTGDIEMGHFPKVVELLADHVENADEVYYELGKDLLKLSGLQRLAENSMPAAIKEIKRLAHSLKENDEAKRYRQPNEPLSQVRPSTAGTDAGAMSVSDYRKKYRV